MRIGLSRTYASAIGAAVVLSTITYAFNRGRPAASMASAAAGTASVNVSSTNATPTVPGPQVDADWLSQRFSDDSVIVIDVRPAAQYAAGHIDGAINVPAATVDGGAPSDQIEKAFSQAGVDTRHAVVVYDDGSNDKQLATRAFVALRAANHPALTILTGGYAQWTKKGLPTSTSPTQLPPTTFVASAGND